jgi:hypothetical protein
MIISATMSVCVAFNLSDGVVIAVDSATTMIDVSGAISKVFLDADKLFQLGDLRVGLATYGLASLHGRTIGSFVRQFLSDEANADIGSLSLRDLVERLRRFFYEHYRSYFELVHSLPFDDIPANLKGQLGLVVGGFSAGSFQSELWNVVIPVHQQEFTAIQKNAAGAIGFSWYASSIPISRYIKGIDPALSASVRSVFETILGRGLEQGELDQFGAALEQHEYRIRTEGMPIQSGIACAKFLVDLVLGHYRFCETHPIVGGKTKIGVVRYDHNAFQILE